MDFQDMRPLDVFQEGSLDDRSTLLANSAYVYSPLPEGHVRLLHINSKTAQAAHIQRNAGPASSNPHSATAPSIEEQLRALAAKSQPGILKTGRWRDARSPLVSCTLSIHALSDTPEYVALSYAWGKYSSDCELLLDGERLLIRKNLWRFLLEAQSAKKTWPPLWIDALCIDQSNTLERSQQVQMMPQIFHNAASALVWLGPSFAGSDQAMNDLNRHEQHFSRGRTNHQLSTTPNMSAALISLSSRAYWTRLWIYQEIQLAQRAVLMCGRKKASWLTFCHALKHHPGLKTEAGIQRSLIGHTPAYSIVGTTELTPRRESIFNLMSATQHLQCAETRDKIFALLGMSRTSSIKIVPDYTAPIVVLLNFVLREHHDLHPPRTLDNVQRQCAQLEEMMGQSPGSMLALYAFHGRLVPRQAVMQHHPLRQEHQPLSLWWCDHYQHHSIAALLLNHQDSDTARWFVYAAQDGNLPAIEMLLRHGVKASELNRSRSALGAAASRGHVDVVRLILHESSYLQQKEYAEECVLAFEVAAFEQHHAVMQILLERAPHVRGSVGKEARGRAMVQAATQGSEVIVKLLLDKEMELAAEDWSSALKNSVSNRHTSIALSILDHVPEIIDKRGLLHAAASAGHTQIVEVLLSQAIHMVDIDQLHQHHTVTSTSLYAAVAKGHIAVVKLLIRHGADVHEAKRYDNYAYNGVKVKRYRHAIYSAAERGDYDMVEMLLDAGVGIKEAVLVDWNAFLGAVEVCHALFAAARTGYGSIVSLMLARGADIIRDSLFFASQDGVILHRPSMLLTAATNKHFRLVDFLIAQGAEVFDAPCTNGRDMIEDGRLAAADAAYMAGRTDLKLKFLAEQPDNKLRPSFSGRTIARREGNVATSNRSEQLSGRRNSLRQGPSVLYLEQTTQAEASFDSEELF